MIKKGILAALLFAMAGQTIYAGEDIVSVIGKLRKGKAEAAVKARTKVKVTTSPDQFLYQLSDCLLYGIKGYSQYNPKKSYEVYKKIAYSDYVTNKRVMDCFREHGFDMEKVRMEVEGRMLEYAREKGTAAAYDEIIKLCDNCSYMEDAKRGKEDLVLNRMLKGATLQDIEKFIADYPDSPNLQKAIDMRDSMAFARLPKTADSYAAYIEKYPNSKYVPQLQKGLQKMSYEDAKKNDDVNSYAKYIANYPEDTKAVAEFTGKINSLQEVLTWKVKPEYKSIKLVKDTTAKKQYYILNNYGVCGIADFKGKVLVEPQFEDLSDVDDNRMLAKKGGKWGVINPTDGTTIFEFIANSASDIMFLSKDFIAFKQNGLWGASYKGTNTAIMPFVSGGTLTPFKYKVLSNGGLAMTDAGRLVIVNPDGTPKSDETYDQVQWRTTDDIDSRFMKVRKGKKYGIYNQSGDLMDAVKHDMMPYYDLDGVAIIKTDPINEGWMDTTGTNLYLGQLAEYKDCGADEKMIAYKVGAMWGFLDKTAAKANLDRQYADVIEVFAKGMARVKTKDGRIAYINKSGTEIVSVAEGQAATMKRCGDYILKKTGGNTYEVYDKQGKVTELNCESVEADMSNGVLIIKQGGKYGAMKNGVVIVEPKYDEMSKYCNGYSIVSLDGKKGLLYFEKVVLEPKYDRILDPSHYFAGDCDALLDGGESPVVFVNTFEGATNMKYVLCKGKTVLSTADEVRVKKFANKFAAVETAEMGLFNNAKTALVSPDGKLLVEPYYRSIEMLSNDYFTCKNGEGRVGVVDKGGLEVVAPFAQSITGFNGKVVVAEMDGDVLCFNKYGVPYLPKGSDLDGQVFKNKATKKYGLVDDKGFIKLYTNYGKITDIVERSAVVQYNDKYGVIKY